VLWVLLHAVTWWYPAGHTEQVAHTVLLLDVHGWKAKVPMGQVRQGAHTVLLLSVHEMTA
jgi:hypothetical protein